ncbi:acyl-CoA N-acyltransferase [Thozetella sp. PMI_491]|nr:acyl-CoA N-acyltransferase [Thozetella sp. PMI_491]
MAEPAVAPTPGPRIEKAKPENVTKIKAMVDAAYSKYIPRIGKPPAPMLADYNKVIEANDVFVLQPDDGDVIGSIILTIEDGADSVKVNNLVVDPAAQGRGYGRVLMAFAENFAKERGYAALTLFTNVMMHENMVLYPKLGFVETGRKTEDGYQRVYYRKEI